MTNQISTPLRDLPKRQLPRKESNESAKNIEQLAITAIQSQSS